MSDPHRPGDVPPDLPPEYAEAYRRGYAEKPVTAAENLGPWEDQAWPDE